jgi:hypothetical protein
MGQPITEPGLLVASLGVAVFIALSGCSQAPAGPTDTSSAAIAADEIGEPHDQSAFGKDPSQTHVMSPDDPDLQPQPDPAPAEGA